MALSNLLDRYRVFQSMKRLIHRINKIDYTFTAHVTEQTEWRKWEEIDFIMVTLKFHRSKYESDNWAIYILQ